MCIVISNKLREAPRLFRGAPEGGIWTRTCEPVVRPSSLLRLSLLSFVDSEFPGNSLQTGEFHPSKLRL